MADGTAMTIVDHHEAVPSAGFMPLWNMWWPHTIQERNAIADHRERHRVVAEDRLAREDRQDLGGDAHRGQDQDVDLGVAEEPEEMLPEQRLAAARRAGRSSCRPCDRRAASPRADVSTGSASRSRIAVMKSDQITSGIRNQAHARRAHVDDGGDVVDRAHQRRYAEDEEADAPEVLAPVDAGVLDHRRQRRVRRPARRPRTARHEEAAEHDDAGGERRPEREHVEHRERHVAGADHERDAEVAEAARPGSA